MDTPPVASQQEKNKTNEDAEREKEAHEKEGTEKIPATDNDA